MTDVSTGILDLPRLCQYPDTQLQIIARLARLWPSSRALAVRRDCRDALRLKSADVVVVSYPKSGRTFLRAIMSRLYGPPRGLSHDELIEYDNFHALDASLPRVLFTHDGDVMREPGRIHADKSAYHGKRVILLARHPADVLVSRHSHLRYRSRDMARRNLGALALHQFAWRPEGALPSIVAFLNSWAEMARSSPDVHLVRFEELLNTPNEAVDAIVSFAGIRASGAGIRAAIAECQFDRMQAKEQSGQFSSQRLGPRMNGNPQSLKVRSGRAGGYRDQFSASECLAIDNYIARHLDPIYYGAAAP